MGKRILASGKFDLLHPGHIHYLKESADLSDGGELWVVITHEENMEENLFSNQERKRVVEALETVDRVVVGKRKVDYESVLKEVDPDVVTVGYDQERKSLEKAIRKLGKDIEIKEISPLNPEKYSSTILKSLIGE